ncbi:transporter substrate-binding domain-containing protein [Shewanella cyperi]|uniref:Transporter substrate-binding domain-containing protein n=1 Tax=Shewanella cyperi TaxID=2814292 RepID=A0A974XJW5_9GAMM|nr:transporter substrate-binding domain-containing protein [Shewanella cyperi]QSX29755.1 transporter substrate-binding domain-containing protein [Shewanella cyperi]
MLKNALFTLLLAISPVLANAEEPITEINVVSEVWTNATEKSGRGLYWDMLRLVYQQEGIKLNFETMPYARSVNKVMANGADAWVGASPDEVADAVYPKLPLDEDQYYALYSKGKVANWQGEQSLAEKRVGWSKGYQLDSYLKVKVEASEFLKLKVGINRLQSGELDFVLDARYDLEQEMQRENIDPTEFEMQKVIVLPTFIAFANNERGHRLAAIYDKQMRELIKSGAIRKLFDQYQWPTFPFEE